MSTTLPNRAYLTSCLRHSVQIQPDDWTSDTLGTIGRHAARLCPGGGDVLHWDGETNGNWSGEKYGAWSCNHTS